MLKQRQYGWRCLALAGMATLVFAGCGGGDDGGSGASTTGGGSEGGDIVLAEVIGASGWLTAFDLPPSNGAKLAIDEINAKGGIDGRKLKMIRTDHQSDPAHVNQATQEALSKGADIVLASCNYEEAGPTAALASAQKKLTFSYCGGEPKFTRQVGTANALTFDMGNETNGVGAVMGKFAIDQGWRRAYVLEDTYSDYTRQMSTFFQDAFKAAGGTIVGRETFKNPDNSVAGQIAAIKAKQAETDVVVLASTLPGAGTALRQMRAAGIDLPILTGDGMDTRSVADTVRNLDNFYFVAAASVYGDDPDPKVNEFFRRLEEKTGEKADGSYALFGYSIIEALEKAIKDAGSADGPKLGAALEGFKDVPLLVGPMTFTNEQHVDPYRPQRILQYKNGKPKYLTTVTPEKVPNPF